MPDPENGEIKTFNNVGEVIKHYDDSITHKYTLGMTEWCIHRIVENDQVKPVLVIAAGGLSFKNQVITNAIVFDNHCEILKMAAKIRSIFDSRLEQEILMRLEHIENRLPKDE